MPKVAILAGLLVACLGASGCERRRGAAIVLGKEHIAATVVKSGDEQSPRPRSDVKESDRDVQAANDDPRAVEHEQWIVKVQMTDDLRRIDVRVDEPRWHQLREGDRVQVSYRIGKYTHTVWSSDLE